MGTSWLQIGPMVLSLSSSEEVKMNSSVRSGFEVGVPVVETIVTDVARGDLIW